MTNKKVLVIVNATGRQAASLVRVASAVGYQVRAHVSQKTAPVSQELELLDNVTLLEGSLEDKELVAHLFIGAHKAFINTISWGDEVAIGKALANAAKKAHVQHYIYSSMPDHSVFGKGWPAVPLWSCKFMVENYIRQIGLPATFVYTGIYNNNFTSLPMPLFRMALQSDGSFEWKAPFDPNIAIPWFDAEHDTGPAILQVFKDGPQKWSGHRIALAFELLTPTRVCRLFSCALRRPVRYVYSQTIDIEVSVPSGYREQLLALEELFGKCKAPYFGLDLEPNISREARALWPGWRGIEEYAREVFPLEEAAHGLTWMNEET
ncbi:NmrA-like family-domain-containing protein [Usnea florida]